MGNTAEGGAAEGQWHPPDKPGGACFRYSVPRGFQGTKSQIAIHRLDRASRMGMLLSRRGNPDKPQGVALHAAGPIRCLTPHTDFLPNVIPAPVGPAKGIWGYPDAFPVVKWYALPPVNGPSTHRRPPLLVPKMWAKKGLAKMGCTRKTIARGATHPQLRGVSHAPILE